MAEALPISGHIDPKAFPLILIDLHKQGATGSLKVDGPSHQKALYFRAGRILFGSSNDPRDQLGAILVESGKLTAEQFEDVNRKVGPGNPLAKALADSGIVSQRELSEAARAKVERIVSDVFTYTSGTFDFEDGVLPKGAVDLKLPTERLFVAAVRRIGDRAFVLRHLDSLSVVLAPVPDLANALPEIESECGALPEALDGSRTLREAAAAAGMDEFEAAKVACSLLFLGLVERSSGAEEAGESPFAIPGIEEESSEIGFDSPNTLPFAGSDAESTVVVESSEMGVPPPAESSLSESIAETFPSPPEPPPAAPPAPRPLSEAMVPPPPKTRAAGAASAAHSKPSKDDLAALDSLLKSEPVEGPLSPLAKGSEPEWHPQFLPEAKRGAHRKPAPSGRRSILLGGAIALVVVLGAVGGYMWYSGSAPAEPPQVADAQASPTPASPALATGASPSAAGSPEAPAPSGASAAPAAPGTSPSSAAAPPRVTPTPAPAAQATPTPATRPTPAPTPARAATAPAAATTAAAGGSRAPVSLAESRAFLRSGRHAEAARAFASILKPAKGSYTIQLMVACSDETIQKAVSAVRGDELFILPTRYGGRNCYRMCWGVFDGQAKASGGVKTVPAYFVEGGAKPKVVTTASVVP